MQKNTPHLRFLLLPCDLTGLSEKLGNVFTFDIAVMKNPTGWSQLGGGLRAPQG